ncbi:MAG: gliding motility-associated C-terminal domain-containing protein [Saprospiraceae bacterium]|nr:gliding motility-associated C-terminal domain-containing protein [Saprospiraceae bacterium]
MISLYRKILLIIVILSGASLVHATHNRAGEITYEQIGELTIRMKITTYTKSSSTAADRDSLEVFWGDGTSEFVLRSNGNGDPLPNDVKVNFYIAEHTYPGRAQYTIYFTDPNRVSSILNVNPPNSIDIPFFLSTTFTLLDPQFQGFNNSAVLLQPPLDFACIGRDFIHNPNAFDADGDSLTYELIEPLQGPDDVVPNYIYPNNIGPGDDNMIELDPLTGTFIWRTPQIQGEYNIAFRINEYRQGVLINSLIRDMQILVRACENLPPEVEAIDEICIVAGERLEIPIEVTDPDSDQQVLVEATGGPLTFTNGARLSVEPQYQDVPIDISLIWDTECEHISDQFYQVVIRAVDNYFGDSTGLATLKTIRIKVVGPAPENLSGVSDGGKLRIEWDLPYICEDAPDEYFQGFSVWRKIESKDILPDTCSPGLEGRGYEKIVFITTENDGNKYFYEDADVQDGNIYCYRVLAEFARLTTTNNPFNRVESLPSNEICLILKRDLPFITEATIISTSTVEGSARVSWTKPYAVDLDTLLNPGPYTYQVQRRINQEPFIDIPGASFTSQYFNQNVDTSYFDFDLNTQSTAIDYRIAFFTGSSDNDPFGFSNPASTIFLTAIPSDRKAILSWAEETPWSNYSYEVFRRNFAAQMFESIGITSEPSYTDEDLENGEEYCYLVTSEGKYGISGIIDPIFNNSQIACTVPFDSVPPCPPVNTVTNKCEEARDDPDNPINGNTISWNLPQDCEEELSSYNIYYRFAMGDEYTLIENVSASQINEFFHELAGSISGCYVVTALDTLNNESTFSNEICVENCPGYILPNTFTPNDDDANDLFTPRVNRFIDEIELEVFNQWGNKVFETSDPQINWDGKNMSGKDLAEGVYYYTCRVFELTTDGTFRTIDVLKGHINLIR